VLGEPDRQGVCVVMMKRIILGSVFVAGSVMAAQAEDLANGEYTGSGDGYDLTLTVRGNVAEITSTAYRQCSGGGTGQFSSIAEGRWMITMTEHGQCLVDVTLNNGALLLEPRLDGECWQYSGQACGLAGAVSR
jgi:hypothetical protein